MIKELIERVKLTPEEMAHAALQGVDKAIAWSRENYNATDFAYSNMRENCILESVAEAQLNKVLNDPDLYVQDRKNLVPDCKCGGYDFIPFTENGRVTHCYECDAYNAGRAVGIHEGVIPLREAIKEVKE